MASLAGIDSLRATQPLPALVVIIGSEPLLVLEAGDALRERARNEGFTEQHSLVLDARSDWQQIFGLSSNGSLFGERQFIQIALPSGKPGKAGGNALESLAQQCTGQTATDSVTVLKLPALDRTTRQTAWAKAICNSGHVIELADVSRQALPQWISARLARAQQSMDDITLDWLADRVEGNLLAAHQEIQKLALLYEAGPISLQQCQTAVMNVARYDVFALRDAMLDGQADRMLRILWGLKAEGEALPLVLWALGEDIRILARIRYAVELGEPLAASLKANRLFGAREQRARRALNRVSANRWQRAITHAHEIDRIIKGVPVAGRLTDPWQELARLAMGIAATPGREHAS